MKGHEGVDVSRVKISNGRMVVETHPRMADGTQYASTTHPPSVSAGIKKVAITTMVSKWWGYKNDNKKKHTGYQGAPAKELKGDGERSVEIRIPKQT